MFCGVWPNILQDQMINDDCCCHLTNNANIQDIIGSFIIHLGQKFTNQKVTPTHHFQSNKTLLHKQMKSKDNNLQLHQCLGHGSPSTTSLSFGRGGFDFLALDAGLGLDDCGLSGVTGGLFCGSSSSEEV